MIQKNSTGKHQLLIPGGSLQVLGVGSVVAQFGTSCSWKGTLCTLGKICKRTFQHCGVSRDTMSSARLLIQYPPT